jgi:hypothetical protein
LDDVKFFTMEDAEMRGAFVFRCLEPGVDPTEILKGETYFPTAFALAEGTRKCDLHITDLFHVFLVSERFVDKTTSLNATGVRFTKVNVGNAGHVHYGLSVYGRSGGFDKSKAEERERVLPGGLTLKRKMGLSVPMDSWDGSDFFVPEGSAACIVTERLAAVLSQLRNVGIRSLADMVVA